MQSICRKSSEHLGSLFNEADDVILIRKSSIHVYIVVVIVVVVIVIVVVVIVVVVVDVVIYV